MLTQRLTVYLTDSERKQLRRLARDHGASENLLVRLAVRGMLELPAPQGADTLQHLVTRCGQPAEGALR